MSGEPWCPEPLDPDPVCGHCGSASWDDEKAACTACGDTIFDVAERISSDEAARKMLERAQAIRDHQTQGGPE